MFPGHPPRSSLAPTLFSDSLRIVSLPSTLHCFTSFFHKVISGFFSLGFQWKDFPSLNYPPEYAFKFPTPHSHTPPLPRPPTVFDLSSLFLSFLWSPPCKIIPPFPFLITWFDITTFFHLGLLNCQPLSTFFLCLLNWFFLFLACKPFYPLLCHEEFETRGFFSAVLSFRFAS